jgi:hypothetical protein
MLVAARNKLHKEQHRYFETNVPLRNVHGSMTYYKFITAEGEVDRQYTNICCHGTLTDPLVF